MFSKAVRIDGTLYQEHRVERIEHTIYGITEATVLSTAGGQSIRTRHNIAYQIGVTFAQAEQQVSALPFFSCDDPYAEVLTEVADLLTDEQAEQVPDAFPEWAAGTDYKVGDRRRYDGKLYRCVQAHTSQDGWEPQNVPALWVRTAQEGEIPEWAQPTGAHDAYSKGDKVTRGGKTWVSTVDGNVWEPGVYGWDEVAE